MSNIYILDTGYANTAATGNRSAVATRAGYDSTSGTVRPFLLRVKDISYSGGANIADQEELKQTETLSDLTPVSHKNPALGFSCDILKSELTSTTMNKNWLYQFLRLERTKTVKVVYLDTSPTNIQNAELVEYIGAGNKNGTFSSLVGGTTVPYLLGFITVDNVRVGGADRSKFDLAFTLKLTDGNTLS